LLNTVALYIKVNELSGLQSCGEIVA